MTPENKNLMCRLLAHNNFDVDRFEAEQKKKKEEKLNSAHGHLRKCLREQQAIDKFEKVREELM